VTTIGVIGAGTMGSGIAIALANAGYRVVMVDTDAAALVRAAQYIAENYAALQRKGRLDRAQIDARLECIRTDTAFSAVAQCALVIEAVFESLALKADVFAQLGATCARDTILATNTSTLDVDAIAAAATRPERCAGMHFFSPAQIMKLVEVVRGRQTSDATIESICALARAIGKTPVVVANADGFVGNRMLLGYRREAEFLVLSGAAPREIDAALEQFGFALGPFAVSDLAGLDIGVRAKHERAARGEAPPFELTRIPDKLVEAGRFGRKSGQGYYPYTGDRAGADDVFTSIVAGERTRLGVRPRAVSAEEIVERCVLALINEGARILDARIAASADDVDTIWRLGYGFPAARGGPMRYAESIGFTEVAARIELFAATDPAFWQLAPYIRQRANRV